VVLALAVVLLSLAGHAAGSSMLPSGPGLLVAAVLAFALTAVLGARPTAIRLFGLVLGTEAMLHVVFVVMSDCHPAGTGVPSLLPSATSAIGHVVAAVVAVAVLREGDEVLARWSALLLAVCGAPELLLAGVSGRPALAEVLWDARAFGADSYLTSHARRGPPSA
jgi:hypothetical protein